MKYKNLNISYFNSIVEIGQKEAEFLCKGEYTTNVPIADPFTFEDRGYSMFSVKNDKLGYSKVIPVRNATKFTNDLIITTLSNGKRVGNFSSPHDFIFEDDSILPSVSNSTAEEFSVIFNERELGNGDVYLSFNIPQNTFNRIHAWCSMEVDVVFCPLPMIVALREIDPYYYILKPFRSIRMVSRTDKRVSISKQCI